MVPKAYSLSLRFQILENMRVAKVLREILAMSTRRI